MSTRCNIIIKDRRDRIILYHHHDGYPSGVGSDLKKFLATFQDWQIRQHGHWKITNDLVKNNAGLNDDEYEISPRLHGDIDYCYVINCVSGTLLCYSCRYLDYNEELGRYNWHKVFKRDNLREIPDPEPEEPKEDIIVKRNDIFEEELMKMLDDAILCYNSPNGLQVKELSELYAPTLLEIAKGPFYIHIKQ